MSDPKKEEPRIFKLWKCPFCGDMFNYRATEHDTARNFLYCPSCYSEVPILRKKHA